MIYVILGVGSNRSWQGNDSIKLLKKACDALSSVLSEFTCSSVYLTKPMYVKNQEDFYNMAVSGYVSDSVLPDELLFKINQIEQFLGRNRSKEIRNGPRSIDIDIEIFGNQKINTKNLTIPHPRIQERAFVLIPMVEILGESADSIERGVFLRYLEKLDCSGVKKILSAEDFIKGKL